MDNEKEFETNENKMGGEDNSSSLIPTAEENKRAREKVKSLYEEEKRRYLEQERGATNE